MATKRVYDPATKTWKQVVVKDTKTKAKPKNSGSSNDKSGLSDSNSHNKSAKSKAIKKVNRKTLRTLEGNLSYVPNENTIKIKPRDTIELKGLGKYLSGKYYVVAVDRTFNSGGYSQTATVVKTNFKKSLKVYAKYPDEKSKLKAFDDTFKKNLDKYMASHKKAKPKKHTVVKGDTLYTISKKYYKTTKYAKTLAKINGNLAKSKWTKLPVGYKLIIAKK